MMDIMPIVPDTKESRSEKLFVRLTAKDMERVKQASEALGADVSATVRAVILKWLDEDEAERKGLTSPKK